MRRAASLALPLGLLLATGCPQLLEDDFEVGPAAVGSGGTGPDAAAGAGGSSGAAGAAGGTSGAGGSSAGTGGSGGNAGVAGVRGTGGVPCNGACPLAECCDGECVDLATNREHCNGCGNACPGTTCVSGACTNTCILGFLDCDQNAVNGCEANAAMDVDNCGSCGVACPMDGTCTSGSCACPLGSANCDGDMSNGCEIVTDTDPLNCGNCGMRCGPNQRCVDGQCGCDDGFEDCNGNADDGCEAPLDAPATCGSCTNDCGPGSTCTAGSCGCMTGLLDCTADPGCESSAEDPATCSDCTTSCAGGMPLCDGTSCVSACTGGLTECGGGCVNTQTSLTHCGGCSQPVGAHQTCIGGVPTCEVGFADCNTMPGDGCEVDTTSDPLNCNGCGNTCKAGAQCTASACECKPSTPNDCGAECRECCDADDCSDGDPCTTNVCTAGGSCDFSSGCDTGVCCAGQGCFECCSDNDCTDGKTCSGNTCVDITCDLPNLVCDAECIDPASDARHCGGCERPCGQGRTCSSSVCTPSWVPLATPPGALNARRNMASVNAGGRLFVWGGARQGSQLLDNGALYDPSSDGWTLVSDSGAPSARTDATAVWTGTRVFVWGGGNASGGNVLATGAIYDPGLDSWSPVSTTNAPSARRLAHGVWTGSRVAIWGGVNGSGDPVGGGALYDPNNDTWTTISSTAAPGPRLNAAAAWSGTQWFFFGGSDGANPQSGGHAYTPDTWSALAAGGPDARAGAFGAWDGSFLVVFGGADGNTVNDGMRYEPLASEWTSLASANAPSKRQLVRGEHGWAARVASGRTLILGGRGNGNSVRTDGAIYDATTNSWGAVAPWPGTDQHIWSAGAWVAGEFVLWGGSTNGNQNALTTNGVRLKP